MKTFTFIAGHEGDHSVGEGDWEIKVTIVQSRSMEQDEVEFLKKQIKESFDDCDGVQTEYEWKQGLLDEDGQYFRYLESDKPKGWKKLLKEAKKKHDSEQKEIDALKESWFKD